MDAMRIQVTLTDLNAAMMWLTNTSSRSDQGGGLS
jgi:hypothetical protein